MSQVGAQKNHLKLVLGNDKLSLNAVGWGMADHGANLFLGEAHDLAFHLEMDRWNGRELPQILLLDIGKSGKQVWNDTDSIQLDLMMD